MGRNMNHTYTFITVSFMSGLLQSVEVFIRCDSVRKPDHSKLPMIRKESPFDGAVGKARETVIVRVEPV